MGSRKAVPSVGPWPAGPFTHRLWCALLLGGLAVPAFSLFHVPPPVEQNTEVVHGIGVALVGGLAAPVFGLVGLAPAVEPQASEELLLLNCCAGGCSTTLRCTRFRTNEKVTLQVRDLERLGPPAGSNRS